MSRRLGIRWSGAALLATAAVAASGVVLFGAPSVGADPKVVTGGTASYALPPGDVFTWIIPIEPGQTYESYEQSVEDSSYLPLYWFGKGAHTGITYRLSIAHPPVWSDADKTVTVRMKNTLKWSTGSAVTSKDVRFFFELYQVGKTQIGNYLPGLLPDNIASITYPDAYTFVLHLKHAFNPLWYEGNQLGWIYPLPVQSWDKASVASPASLANSSTPSGAKAVFTFILSQAKSRQTYTTNPMWKVADGPFAISSYNAVTHTATFARNSHYTGPTKPHLAAYSVYSFTTSTPEVNLLRSGKLTFGYLPFSDLSESSYFNDHGYTVKPWPIFYDQAVEFGYTSKTWGPLARQLYIRQALQHLITEKLYITRTLGGDGLPDYGSVAVFPHSQTVAPAIRSDPYPYDPTAAAHLLSSHGWAKGSGGSLVCKRQGSAPADCGKGISKGRVLTFLFIYATGTTAYFAMVSAFRTAAQKVGIDLKLEGRTITSMFSTAGVCATSQQKETKTTATGACNWGLAGYSGYIWSYGQYELVPAGEDQFGAGNFWAGGYYTAKAQGLIRAAETKSGLKPLYKAESYVSKDVASLWWPLQDWEVAVVKKSLAGWQHLNPYANYMPQTWYFTGSS